MLLLIFQVLSSSRSVFYVPVDGTSAQKADAKDNSGAAVEIPKENAQPTVVSPSTDESNNQLLSSKDEQVDISDMDGNLSPEQYDTDEDNLENDYENLDPIYEELSEVSNSSKSKCKVINLFLEFGHVISNSENPQYLHIHFSNSQ